MHIYTSEEAQSLYNQLIASNKDTLKVRFQTQSHHIIPKSLGGCNDTSNLVNLYHKDHFLAHYYLWLIYGGKMAIAFQMMYQCNTPFYSKDLLEEFALEYQKTKENRIISDDTKRKTCFSLKGHYGSNNGRILTIETKIKMSESAKGKPKSVEHKKNIGKAQKGKTLSQEHKNKISEKQKGTLKPKSDEHCLKISSSLKGRTRSLESIEKQKETVKNRKKGI